MSENNTQFVSLCISCALALTRQEVVNNEEWILRKVKDYLFSLG